MCVLLEKWQFLWLLCVYLMSFYVCKSSGISPEGEALVSFRTAVVNSDGTLLHWRQEDTDPCDSKGVKCDPKTKRVIFLNLANHKLSGSISSGLGKLDQMEILILHDNNFYGTIPSELGNCSELKGLFLQCNYLSGPIPSELGNLPELENLDMSSNSLSGNIPTPLGKLNKLMSLYVLFSAWEAELKTYLNMKDHAYYLVNIDLVVVHVILIIGIQI